MGRQEVGTEPVWETVGTEPVREAGSSVRETCRRNIAHLGDRQ